MLSLISLLPDGLPDTMLWRLFSHMSESQLLKCKECLLSLSLVQLSGNRLRVLAPIRGYMERRHFPEIDGLSRLGNFYINFICENNAGTLASNAQEISVDECHFSKSWTPPFLFLRVLSIWTSPPTPAGHFRAFSKLVNKKKACFFYAFFRKTGFFPPQSLLF